MNPQDFSSRLRSEISKTIVGQDRVVAQLLACLMSGGHALIQGVPGLAKTLLARTLAAALGLRFKRIQFTPDLMPSDVTGTSVFDMATSTFSLRQGPVFTDVLLADEINRTPPKTQSALLEAMEERTVTIDGNSHRLPEGFFVIATQNPIEYEGTYPLPEAQMDRFMMRIEIGYPAEEEEIGILDRAREGFDPMRIQESGVGQAADSGELAHVREQCVAVSASDALIRYIAQIVRTSRESGLLTLGASPRAGVSMLAASRAWAAMEGRDFIIPDDVKEVAPAVLRHRLILSPESLIDGLSGDAIVEHLLSDVPVPR